MTSTQNVPPPTTKLWDQFVVVVVPISGLIIAVATVIITYQISRISDLAGDIKNVNGRVDQIYPLIAQSTSDLGYIKGSLEATTQKITTAGEKTDGLTKRLESLVSAEETQAKNIQDIGTSVANLSKLMVAQQQKIEDINNKLNPVNPLYQKNNFLTGAKVFSPRDWTEILQENTGNTKLIPINWENKKAISTFFKALQDSKLDFVEIVITTKDATVAKYIESTLVQSGPSSVE